MVIASTCHGATRMPAIYGNFAPVLTVQKAANRGIWHRKTASAVLGSDARVRFMRAQLFSMFIALGLVVASAHVARADDDGDEAGDSQEQGDHDGGSAATPSHADPATKTLPTTASATAQANAFGQQGARERAAHQAAKAAASNEAKKAAGQAIAASHRAGHPSAHAGNSHAAAGHAHAAAAAGNGHAHH
jgi:hypothetical protein